MGLDQTAKDGNQPRHGGFGIGRSGKRFLRQELSVHVSQGDRGLDGADVDADDHGPVVEPEKGGAAAARQASGRSFDDPLFADELFDDQGYRAALQSGKARQIRPGGGLTASDQAEQDSAIDVAGYV